MVAEDMSPVVTYEYDAWGKLLNVDGEKKDTVGKLNLFRYRGYVYEEERGLYYVTSRYYDPEVGRWINEDVMLKTPGISVLSTNMFAYCENNPVMRSDSSGQWFGVDDFIAGAVGGIVGAATQLISDVATSIMKGPLNYLVGRLMLAML